MICLISGEKNTGRERKRKRNQKTKKLNLIKTLILPPSARRRWGFTLPSLSTSPLSDRWLSISSTTYWMKSKKTLCLGTFLLALLMIACQLSGLAFNDRKKLSSSMVPDRDLGEVIVGSGQFFNCLCSFSSISCLFLMERFVPPFDLASNPLFGVSDPLFEVYVFLGNVNNVVYPSKVKCLWCDSFFAKCSSYGSRALKTHCLRKGSPRHSFLAFFSNSPRSCNVSVSCRWTIPEAQQKLMMPDWILKLESCRSGIKRTTWNHNIREGSPRHSLSCRRTILNANMIKRRKKEKLEEKEKEEKDEEVKIEEEEEEEEEEVKKEEDETKEWKKKEDEDRRTKKTQKKSYYFVFHRLYSFDIVNIFPCLVFYLCFSSKFIAPDSENQMRPM